jgi:hypothetical protein
MKAGDILIDDFLKYRHLWEEAGGIFIRHISAKGSLEKLAFLGIDIRPTAAGLHLERLL